MHWSRRKLAPKCTNKAKICTIEGKIAPKKTTNRYPTGKNPSFPLQVFAELLRWNFGAVVNAIFLGAMLHTRSQRNTYKADIPVCKAWHERWRDSWGSPNPAPNGQQAAPSGAASLVWGSLSTGSATFCILFGGNVCPKMFECPKIFKNCPKLLGGYCTPAPTRSRRNLPHFAGWLIYKSLIYSAARL